MPSLPIRGSPRPAASGGALRGSRTAAHLQGGAGSIVTLELGSVVRDRDLHETPERRLVRTVLLEDVDRPPLIAFEASIEQLGLVRELRPLHEGHLHLPLVGIGDRDHPVAVPDGRSHPLPILGDRRVGLEHDPTDRGEDLATPVGDAGDVLVDALRGVHLLFPGPS